MAEAVKTTGILSKIKSLVARTGRSIIWRGRPKDNDISQKIAQKIQKNSYDFSMLQRKDTFTPPYLSLLDQLQVDDDQIFRAAVYNMANIAIARPKYAEDIINIFNGYAQRSDAPAARREYMQNKLSSLLSHQKK